MTSATDFENDTFLSKSLEESTLLEESINMPTLSGDPKLEAMNLEGQDAWIKKSQFFEVLLLLLFETVHSLVQNCL